MFVSSTLILLAISLNREPLPLLFSPVEPHGRNAVLLTNLFLNLLTLALNRHQRLSPEHYEIEHST